jgi:hypothetical protein
MALPFRLPTSARVSFHHPNPSQPNSSLRSSNQHDDQNRRSIRHPSTVHLSIHSLRVTVLHATTPLRLVDRIRTSSRSRLLDWHSASIVCAISLDRSISSLTSRSALAQAAILSFARGRAVIQSDLRASSGSGWSKNKGSSGLTRFGRPLVALSGVPAMHCLRGDFVSI